MDADKCPQGEEEEQAGHLHSTEQTSKFTATAKSSPRSSIDGQNSAAGTDADADLLSSDMDRAGDGYRRRRAQLMNGMENGKARRKSSSKKHYHRHRNAGAPDEENKQLVYSSDESNGSDFSSRTTSEDFELDHLAAEDSLGVDEETGLTKKDKNHRKRRRRKAVRMDERFAGNVGASKQNATNTHREIYKAWLINALLVASWYAFSLSISIVSEDIEPSRSPLFVPCQMSAHNFSVQQMDVLGKIPRFSFPSFHYLPAYACPILPGQPRPVLHSTNATSFR